MSAPQPSTAAERARGIEYARRWRALNKPLFDAHYGAERRCPNCGCKLEHGDG